MENKIQAIISKMTLKEKVGQLCVPILQSADITDEIVIAIKEMGAGMIRYCPNATFDNLSEVVGEPNKYFTPSQTAKFTNSLQEVALQTKFQIPLLIAVDQEGSTRSDINRGGALVYPGHMAFGAADDEELTYQIAKATASEFKAMGINLVQAPIIDVLRYEGRKTIKAAAFGETVDLVCRHGKAMMRGFREGGIATMAKHFPGYGSIAVDAHKGTTEIIKPLEVLEKEDIAPFKTLFADNIDGIMIGHAITKCIDNQYPATLSKKVIKQYLRKKLKYDGIVETDAMRMRAIQDNYSTAEASVLAVQAGCDLVLLRGDFAHYKEGYDAILNAVLNGEITEKELNESIRRILTVKFKLGLFENPFVNPKEAEKIVGCAKHRELSKRLAKTSISLIKSRHIPLDLKEDKSILIISVEPQKIAAAMDDIQSPDMLIRAIKRHHKNTNELLLKLSPIKEDIKKAVQMANKSDVVIIGVCNALIFREQISLVKALQETNKPIIVVAMDSPYDIEEFPSIQDYVCTYGVANDSMVAAADLIFGHLKSSALPPVKLNI